jgi:hypothetical protein
MLFYLPRYLSSVTFSLPYLNSEVYFTFLFTIDEIEIGKKIWKTFYRFKFKCDAKKPWKRIRDPDPKQCFKTDMVA